jgi:hypothetical protein
VLLVMIYLMPTSCAYNILEIGPFHFLPCSLSAYALLPTAVEAEASTSSTLLWGFEAGLVDSEVVCEILSQGYGAVAVYILIGLDDLGDVPIQRCTNGDLMKRGPTTLERKY